MDFATPAIFKLFWVPLILALFLWWMYRVRVGKIRHLVDARVADIVAASFHPQGYVLRAAFLVAALLFCGLTLARPRWGFEWQEIKRQGLDIILAIDVSKSMLTTDVKPNRLERTKLAIQDLLKRLKGDRIGLVAFAGDAFVACPLTTDYRGFLMSLNDLSINTIPRGGSNVARAIEEAGRSFTDTAAKYKIIILVTDGESLEGDPLAAAKKAKEQGTRIYTVGVGTAEGELIRVTDDQGQSGFLKDPQGNVVKSRLNESLLQQIATTTGGAYAHASGAQFGLEYIYDRFIGHLEKRDIKEDREKIYFERFQIPLAVGVLCLIVELFIPIRKET